MKKLAIVLLAIVGLASVASGARYMLLEEFTAYHAVVSGRPWASLEPGLQVIILGMLRILGGGFAAGGVALLALAWAWWRAGVAPWTLWGAVGVLLAQWLPALSTTLMLKAANGAAQPPTLAVGLLLTAGLVAVACAWAGARPAPRAAAA